MTERCSCTGLVFYDELHDNVHMSQRATDGTVLVKGCGKRVEIEHDSVEHDVARLIKVLR